MSGDQDLPALPATRWCADSEATSPHVVDLSRGDRCSLHANQRDRWRNAKAQAKRRGAPEPLWEPYEVRESGLGPPPGF
jgi:hypothetical protein